MTQWIRVGRMVISTPDGQNTRFRAEPSVTRASSARPTRGGVATREPAGDA